MKVKGATRVIDYTDSFDDGSTSFDIEAVWYPVDKLGLGIAYDVSDDARTVGLVVTALFGKSGRRQP